MLFWLFFNCFHAAVTDLDSAIDCLVVIEFVLAALCVWLIYCFCWVHVALVVVMVVVV